MSSKSESKAIYFWMDIFCIPKITLGDTDSHDTKELFLTALDLMTLTYAMAETVLVLDSELQELEPRFLLNPKESALSYASNALLFMSCRWMSRSWTLQEGALASDERLWYQTKSSVISHKRCFNPSNDRSENPDRSIRTFKHFSDRQSERVKLTESSTALLLADHIANTMMLPFAGSDPSIFGPLVNRIMYTSDSPNNILRDLSFRHVWESFNGRATSKPEDAFVILANLLDFMVNRISRIKVDKSTIMDTAEDKLERMKIMLLSQERLPIDLLCAKDLPIAGAASNYSTWIPAAPGLPALSPVEVSRSMMLKRNCMVLDPHHGPRGFFYKELCDVPAHLCVPLGEPWAPAQADISLDVDCIPSGSKYVSVSGAYIYLNLLEGAHHLTADLCGTGALFSMSGSCHEHVSVRYVCSLRYRLTWRSNLQDLLAVDESSYDKPICVELGNI